jgi:hypothetical protein
VLIVFLALLCAGSLPARLGAVQIEGRSVSAPVGLTVFSAGLQTPSVALLPAATLGAPSLSPALLAPEPSVVIPLVGPQLLAAAPAPAPALEQVAPALAALEAWQSKAAQRSTPASSNLSLLWDGAHLETPAAPGDAVSPLSAGSAFEPRLAAPEMSGFAEITPGSIFDWKPVAQSPGHGLPLLDRLARRILGREDGRFRLGYEMTNSARREEVRVFLYGERHTDPGLIRENMRRIAADIRPGRGAVVLDEGYLGPRLFGSAAIEYLEKKGLDPEWLGPGAAFSADVEVAGWDEKDSYDESKHPLLQHHMNLLDLNGHLYSPEQGLRYYALLARKALATFKNWMVLRRLAITQRNLVLDRSVKAALAQAQSSGKSLHVIAGAEHLVQRPLLAGVPVIGRFHVRRSLIRALGGASYWVGKPADSPTE